MTVHSGVMGVLKTVMLRSHLSTKPMSKSSVTELGLASAFGEFEWYIGELCCVGEV